MDKNLEIIKSVAHEALPGCRVLLFGSRARNTHRESSDYDIIVVVKKKINPKLIISLMATIMHNLSDMKIYSDVIIQSEKELEINTTLIGHVVRYAMRDAIAI